MRIGLYSTQVEVEVEDWVELGKNTTTTNIGWPFHWYFVFFFKTVYLDNFAYSLYNHAKTDDCKNLITYLTKFEC